MRFTPQTTKIFFFFGCWSFSAAGSNDLQSFPKRNDHLWPGTFANDLPHILIIGSEEKCAMRDRRRQLILFQTLFDNENEKIMKFLSKQRDHFLSGTSLFFSFIVNSKKLLIVYLFLVCAIWVWYAFYVTIFRLSWQTCLSFLMGTQHWSND